MVSQLMIGRGYQVYPTAIRPVAPLKQKPIYERPVGSSFIYRWFKSIDAFCLGGEVKNETRSFSSHLERLDPWGNPSCWKD
jgi:hypothetical protein